MNLLFKLKVYHFARSVNRKILSNGNGNTINTTTNTVSINESNISKEDFDQFSLRNKLLNKINEKPINNEKTSNLSTVEDNNFLVKQPSKNFRWGENNKTHTQQYFIKGRIPEYEQIVKFLSDWKMQDIQVFPTLDLGFNHLKKYSILSTAYNNKHMYKCGKELLKQIKDLDINIRIKEPTLQGRKFDEIIRIELDEIEIFLFTENGRLEADLEYRWTHREEFKQDKILKSNKDMQYMQRYRKYKY